MTSPNSAPARVVFADDDASLREMLRALLGLLPHVTVVGEAVDGIEAVQLVARHYPDTVLLDVNMPRLDGFGAAEVIRSFRPQTRLLLHTAEPDDEKRRRAELLALPLLDKLQISATMDIVETAAIAAEHSLSTDIEPLVLLALAGRADDGVIVVRADESIPFYNPAVAAVLDLPFPPDRVFLGGADGTPRPYRMSSRPFFDPDGNLIGVANYVTDATRSAGPPTEQPGRAQLIENNGRVSVWLAEPASPRKEQRNAAPASACSGSSRHATTAAAATRS